MERIKRLDIGDDEKKAILGENAVNLLKIISVLYRHIESLMAIKSLTTKFTRVWMMARPAGFEPATMGFLLEIPSEGPRSIQTEPRPQQGTLARHK